VEADRFGDLALDLIDGRLQGGAASPSVTPVATQTGVTRSAGLRLDVFRAAGRRRCRLAVLDHPRDVEADRFGDLALDLFDGRLEGGAASPSVTPVATQTGVHWLSGI
jgi:hypothetical protein